METHRVYTLDLALKEVANALWKHAVLLGSFSREVAVEKYRVLRRLIDEKLIVVEHEDQYLGKALEIALSFNVTVYDALYIAQALEKRARLATSDERQARVAKELGIEVLPYLAKLRISSRFS